VCSEAPPARFAGALKTNMAPIHARIHAVDSGLHAAQQDLEVLQRSDVRNENYYAQQIGTVRTVPSAHGTLHLNPFPGNILEVNAMSGEALNVLCEFDRFPPQRSLMQMRIGLCHALGPKELALTGRGIVIDDPTVVLESGSAQTRR
jgi:hypothetical protein